MKRFKTHLWMLTALLALLLPERVMATYVDETYNYMVTLNGSNTIRIQVPCYDQESSDTWIQDGQLWCEWKDKSGTPHKEICFRWKRQYGDTGSDSKDIWINFSTSVDGSFDVTQGNSTSHFTLTRSNSPLDRLVYRNTDGHSYGVSALWRLPYEMLGCELKFTWDVDRNGNTGRSHEKVSGLNSSSVQVPQAQDPVSPQLTAASLSLDDRGMIEIPWFVGTNKLTAARYEFTDGWGKTQSIDMGSETNSGTIKLNAIEPHDNFHIVVSYKDNNDYVISNISSETQNLKMVHAPVAFTARPIGNLKGSVRLTWATDYPEKEDMMEGDFFEIQRSITGEEEDFESIGVEVFVPKTQQYEFEDSTLIESLSEKHMQDGGIPRNLTYRIRRMCTDSWGWGSMNTTVCTAKYRPLNLHLLQIANYTAKWESESARTVKVSWDYADEYGAVWDERAKMKLHVTMKNRDGKLVDNMDFELTDKEIAAREKVITLSRSCVKYGIELFVDRGTSPICFIDDATDAYEIRDASDWNTFVQLVNNGRNQINAILRSDISVSSMVGTKTCPFAGKFDGNGHTLTFKYSMVNEEDCGPFRYVGNATISNLHVNGTINSNMKFVGGIVGRVLDQYDAVIENCHSSVRINNIIIGDATCGGIVGIAHDNDSYNHTLTIRNCIFDGWLLGKNAHSFGGFVGWSRNKVVIENSVFAPDSINVKDKSCSTFARMQYGDKLDLHNGCYTRSIGTNQGTKIEDSSAESLQAILGSSWTVANDKIALRQQKKVGQTFAICSVEDWNTFRQNVNAAQGGEMDAILYADITIDTSVGTEISPYSGIFNGNGHTLTLNLRKDGGIGRNVSPFMYAKDFTIHNLHVNGRTEGANFASGLVGESLGGNNAITNCHVEAEIICNAINAVYTGGFIGLTRDSKNVIVDCLFDGKVTSTTTKKADIQYAGAFVGWATLSLGRDKSYYNNKVVNCLENGSYSSNIGHQGMNYYSGGITISGLIIYEYGLAFGGVNNWTYKTSHWNEAIHVENKSYKDMVTALGSANWTTDKEKAVPVMTTWTKPAVFNVHPTLPDFFHESTGKLEPTLTVHQRQSSVLLSWNTNGDAVDYFMVKRRVKGDTTWDTIVPSIDQMSYEDKDVSPLLDYEYMVLSANDCEGMTYTETEIAQGSCKHTGRVAGYVRMKDGTGVAGMDVSISLNNKEVMTVKTDEAGHFVADGLSYQKQPSITYTVTPVSTKTLGLEVESYNVTFNNKSNDETLNEFVITNCHRFSGFVMYEGTSIPVKGAQFCVDGNKVHNAAGGIVETDFDGSFSFYVLDGGPQKVQAVMDGHIFCDDGYFKSSEGYTFNDDVAQIYFYDDTKVKLTGRVVGGDDQGRLPLDNNLSHNNLGDDLTMVLSLEGDNKSWLVYDNLNPNLTKRDTTFAHPAGKGFKTKVQIQRKRMVVNPDPKTGEYVLMLPPVRWKVTQVYCEGYPTLFQDGMVSEVIDLTNCLTKKDTTYVGTYTDVDKHSVYQPSATYNETYSRIYHAPVEITYRQVGYDTYDYFGDKSYVATTVDGNSVTVPLAYQSADTTAYTFGYPVFSINRKYPIQISVVERYPWNGVVNVKKTDLVKIGGGKVTIHNGMKNGTHTQVVELDSVGEGRFQLEAEQTTRLLTGVDALRTVTMTLEQDGTTYEAVPLKGYILNMFATGAGKDVLVNGQPLLIDVLRDPPGGNSTATLAKGSQLKYTYNLDMKLKAGANFKWTTGFGLQNFTGTVAPATTYGLVNNAETENMFNYDLVFSAEGHRGFSYTINVNEDITTSGDKKMVGAEADLYIGVVQNIVVTPMSTIRAITDSMYQQMIGRLGGGQYNGISNKYGTLVHIAEGKGADGKKYHLVRDESIGYGPEITSQFIHSQKHIQTQLLPEKIKELRELMFIGSASDAQKKANATGKPVYRSLVDADDENFGVINVKDGDAYYYTSTMPEEKGMNYVIHLPNGSKEDEFADEVAEKCQVIDAWIQMIANNEYEKLKANDLVANYDVDGGSKVTYTEATESNYSVTNSYHMPIFVQPQFFDNVDGEVGLRMGSTVGIKIVSSIAKALWKLTDTKATTDGKKPSEFGTQVKFTGRTSKFSIIPLLEYDSKDVSGQSRTYSRKESFCISLDKKSHINVDVYRVKSDTANIVKSNGTFDIYRNGNYYDMVDYIRPYIQRQDDMHEAIYNRGFVYRTRGGATAAPWEDERRTICYKQGTVLDERTKKICNPIIKMDKQSVSGVSVGDAARFKVYMTNESEMPEAATGSMTQFTLCMLESSNPKGAKIYVDGTPLNSTGIDMFIDPGKQIQKTIEVYAGDDFDYEKLELRLLSPSDAAVIYDAVTFDVHYLREAGGVQIASPGDKWIMNTESQWNEKRGWYLPIVISGFDKHQKNFDHIEFQYKESSRGDDSWTNLCSFYADSTLMAAASGMREMIPENGNIKTDFYGEGVVMEKGYDLRAMLYCRDGNSFLTTASKIMSGVKDTRRPQLFGTPEPKEGVLRIGDNVVFNFSEDIEYSYLDKKTNFEIKGEVNNNNISDGVSLLFKDEASVESEAVRNFGGKDVTIDMMIRPKMKNTEMPLFSHGTNGKKLQLWLMPDYHLKAVVNDQTIISTDTIAKNCFTQVAMVMTQDSVMFYNGGIRIGRSELTSPYNGIGPLIFGRTNESNRNNSQFYEGNMMEARLWYRALDGALVGTTYGGKRLTGYEMGLVDYYPMNEGSGHYAMDKTQGANAKLIKAEWAMPRTMSLHLDWDDHGVALNQQALNRTAEQDYTLMFWFKTDFNGRGVLLSNGAGKKTDIGAENQFCIAFEAEKLMYRSNGKAVEVPGDWSDNKWHHYAMTVNRARSTANIYVDNAMRATFSTDSLGGISGGHPLIGAARYDELRDTVVATVDTRNWLKGNVDELCLFSQALPITLIKHYSSKAPQGDEAGLLTYLSFERQERQKNNDIETIPYPYSKKIYLDEKGNVKCQLDPETQQPTDMPIRDFPFDKDVTTDYVLKHIDTEDGAPVAPCEELKNLNFSFVGEGHKVLVDIDELNSRINRRNIYVTLRDVEDKNGNTMASPVTACYYVSNSALQWASNRISQTAYYGDENNRWYISITNFGVTSHTFKIENCPKWLEFKTYSDVVDAQASYVLEVAVNKNLNIGSFDEIIYLTDEKGVSEPLYLNLTVEGEQPEWVQSIPGEMLHYSMNLAGQVFVNGEVDIDKRDIVGVFDKNNQCHGYANVDYSALTGETGIYMTIYDNIASGRELSFKLWQYSTGLEHTLTINGEKKIKFEKSAVLGTDKPVRLEAVGNYVQTFDLKTGWNWISFNVASEELFDLHGLLDGLNWQDGDVLTDMNSNLTLVYRDGKWIANDNLGITRLSPSKAYAIKVAEGIKFPVGGSCIRNLDQRTIELKQGWNGIGYTPMQNLSVETALAYYYDYAEPGDVIKSQNEFAYFTKTSDGTGHWRGSLEYMKPGQGYMMLRKSETPVSFTYPFYEPGSTFIDKFAFTATQSTTSAKKRNTMSLSAKINGFEPEEGDNLVAYADGEKCGEACAKSADVIFMSIEGDSKKNVWFAIERDGEIVATTGEQLTFSANNVIGSPDEPTAINFVTIDRKDGRWYTINGVQLSKRPEKKGMYIYNGNKIVIK